MWGTYTIHPTNSTGTSCLAKHENCKKHPFDPRYYWEKSKFREILSFPLPKWWWFALLFRCISFGLDQIVKKIKYTWYNVLCIITITYVCLVYLIYPILWLYLVYPEDIFQLFITNFPSVALVSILCSLILVFIFLCKLYYLCSKACGKGSKFLISQ